MENIEFLKDQIKRLNHELLKYQEKYPPIGVYSEKFDEPIAPWLIDETRLTPLLNEYDFQLSFAKDQVSSLRSQIDDLQHQLDNINVENQRLHRELRESIQNQMEIHPQSTATQVQLTDEQLLLNLQTQLQHVQKEKESVVDLWKTALQEVDRLETELKTSHFHPRLKSLEQQARQIKEQYTQTVAELNKEMLSLQASLKQAKSEIINLKNSNEEYKMFINEGHFTQSSTGIEQRENIALQKKINEIELSLQKSLEANEKLRIDNSIFEEKIFRLEKHGADHSMKEFETLNHAKEGISLVENAILERDQCLIREKQLTEEIDHLKFAFEKLVDEAGSRTAKEIENVRKQYTEIVNKLNVEIENLQLDNANKQSQIERTIREKRSIENELTNYQQQDILQNTKDVSQLNDLNRRLTDAERIKDEASIKADSLEQQLHRSEMNFKQEHSHLMNELEQERNQMKQLKIDFDLANTDRIRFVEEIDELKRRCGTLSSERDMASRKLQKEQICAEKDLKLKIEEYEIRFHTMDEQHRHGMDDLRSMLANQQKMTARWKEECESITNKFELKVKELRSELTKEKNRNEELKRLLKDSMDKTVETESLLSEYSRNIKRMEDRVRDAENRAKRTSIQISNHLTRERQRQYNKISSDKSFIKNLETSKENIVEDFST